MASSIFLRSVLLLVVCTFSASAFQCYNSPITDKCEEYFKQGGIYIWLQDLESIYDWTDEMGEKLAQAIAEVADDYVILDVTADQHVAQATIGVQVWNDQIRVGFFVLNPSGSEVVPTAFRGPEFYLMMNLNDARIEELFGQKVKAIDPKPEPLAIPIWAVAIMGYVGVVVLCAMGLYATRDWRKRKQHELEESLSMSNMEKGASNGKIPMNDIHPTKKKPLVTYAEAGVQTDRGSGGLKKAISKEKLNEAEEDKAPLSNGHEVRATIENGADEKHEPVANTIHSEETTKDTDALVSDEEHTDDSKASASDDDETGVENKAFEGDDEEEKQQSDHDNSESSEEKEESEESAPKEKKDSDIDEKKEESAPEENEDSDDDKEKEVVEKNEEEEKKEDDKDEIEERKEDGENKEDEDEEDANTQF